jgi:sugar phosphate isomerase/epimerase
MGKHPIPLAQHEGWVYALILEGTPTLMLRDGNQDRLGEIIQKTAPKLLRVSINGADLTTKKPILRLDQGDLDVAGVIKALKDKGYKGPVGLQCYQVPGDVEANRRGAGGVNAAPRFS